MNSIRILSVCGVFLIAGCSGLYPGESSSVNKLSKPFIVSIGEYKLKFSVPGGHSKRYISDRQPVGNITQETIGNLLPRQSTQLYNASWDLGGRTFYPAASVHFELNLVASIQANDFNMETLEGFEKAYWDDYALRQELSHKENTMFDIPYLPMLKGEYQIVIKHGVSWLETKQGSWRSLVRPYNQNVFIVLEAQTAQLGRENYTQIAYDRIINPVFNSVVLEMPTPRDLSPP